MYLSELFHVQKHTHNELHTEDTGLQERNLNWPLAQSHHKHKTRHQPELHTHTDTHTHRCMENKHQNWWIWPSRPLWLAWFCSFCLQTHLLLCHKHSQNTEFSCQLVLGLCNRLVHPVCRINKFQFDWFGAVVQGCFFALWLPWSAEDITWQQVFSTELVHPLRHAACFFTLWFYSAGHLGVDFIFPYILPQIRWAFPLFQESWNYMLVFSTNSSKHMFSEGFGEKCVRWTWPTEKSQSVMGFFQLVT